MSESSLMNETGFLKERCEGFIHSCGKTQAAHDFDQGFRDISSFKHIVFIYHNCSFGELNGL